MKHNLAIWLECGVLEFGESRRSEFVLTEEACANGGRGGGPSARQIEFWSSNS